MEAAQFGLTGAVRKNFRGFKLLDVAGKHIVMMGKPPKSESSFLANNGFMRPIVAPDVIVGFRLISTAR